METFEQVIVMPTKDRLELLKRAVGSVVSQTYSPWRLLIVDDGSTDGTRKYLDELHARDPRITVIRHEQSRGVNAARNAAFATLRGDELVSFLDDDDYFVPGALSTIAQTLQTLPPDTDIMFFNTVLVLPHESREVGYIFAPGRSFADLGYADMMMKSFKSGDCEPVFRAKLFAGERAYRFHEDINGFESEVFMLMLRDGIRIRCFPTALVCKDHSHPDGHLSDYAARRDPASFARAHRRIFRDHTAFFAQHPHLAMDRAITAAKVAVRAGDVPDAFVFAFYYVRSLVRLPFAKRVQDEPQG